ncbi:TPA: hypothetical protein ACSP48_003806 [Aeromonas veronii]|jgi:hypothetical protein|uniref:hypothetical protein n=2 Tax=Aeromonas TaxID=642 RepID=UPI0031FD5A7D|nr:hypothetical protein [Aeromonas veronii AMC24]
MKTYLISYDLNNKSKEYNFLYDEIKKSDTWWHYLESVWVITSREDLYNVRMRLQNLLDRDDRLLVIEIHSGQADGWLPTDAWDWLKNNTTIK